MICHKTVRRVWHLFRVKQKHKTKLNEKNVRQNIIIKK